MKQENRLVAELYRYLAPFIDTTKDIYICLDGQAAETGVSKGNLIDSVLPDMFFNFMGAHHTSDCGSSPNQLRKGYTQIPTIQAGDPCLNLPHH